MSKQQQAQPEQAELIKISEFRRRVWGENGTPLTAQAIRRYLHTRRLPGKRVFRTWYVDWTTYQRLNSNPLIDKVRGAR